MIQHLFCHSVYAEAYPKDGDVFTSLERTRADGLELLTGHFPADPAFKDVTKGVHLPYATDWYSALSGIDEEGMTDDEIRSIHFGRNREEVITNLKNAIMFASALEPAYGVLHACSVRLDDIFLGKGSQSDTDVLTGLADAINSAVSSFPGGEPPFKILFENMWWPGLRLVDDMGVKHLERKLEFNDWGICLDTGHLMNAIGRKNNEKEAISSMIDILNGYSERTKELITAMHFHSSASGEDGKITKDIDGLSAKEKLILAYPYVCKLDPHRPFISPECVQLVETICPEFLTHELSSPSWSDRVSDFIAQASFFR